jgi:hypothetical protein
VKRRELKPGKGKTQEMQEFQGYNEEILLFFGGDGKKLSRMLNSIDDKSFFSVTNKSDEICIFT